MNYDLSILVATMPERRAFWPWLAHQIKQQTYVKDHKVEVLVCDGSIVWEDSRAVFELRRLLGWPSSDVSLVKMFDHETFPHTNEISNLHIKRNCLQAAATGKYFVFMDDDDWHPVDWLTGSIRSCEDGKLPWVCQRGIVYYDVMMNAHWEPRAWADAPIPITTVVRRPEQDLLPKFTPGHSEDVRWFQELAGVAQGWLLGGRPGLISLVHPFNTSGWLHRPRIKNSFRPGLPRVSVNDPSDYGFLQEELKQLQDRLRVETSLA